MSRPRSSPLSGTRFSVTYRLAGPESAAQARALEICLEQTVEYPEALVPSGWIREEIVGRLEALTAQTDGGFYARISYAAECAGTDLTQLLNVIFGNSSLKPGIRVESLDLPDSMLAAWPGPRFGRTGLRAAAHSPERPLLGTALKPMGLSSSALAELAYGFALGGIDFIKDDHGLADQPMSPFAERVRLCARAVERANRETGGQAVYVANVTAPADQLLARAEFAKSQGAGAVMAAPGLTGFDALRQLAAAPGVGLPIFAHPAFLGSHVTHSENGLAHGFLFGQLARLAGADAVIFPNYGGRFAFSPDQCREIVQGTEKTMGALKPSFPCLAGGMSLDRIPELLEVFGRDVIFLIGGGLVTHGPDVVTTCRRFRRLVEGKESD